MEQRITDAQIVDLYFARSEMQAQALPDFFQLCAF